MKINIRKNVFETNSSSTHSLVVATREQKEGFENGTLWFNVTHDWDGKHFLKDPNTGERLPVFVDQETAERVYQANSEAEEKNIFLGEELINACHVLVPHRNPFESMEAEKREDGKYDLHIDHYVW